MSSRPQDTHSLVPLPVPLPKPWFACCPLRDLEPISGLEKEGGKQPGQSLEGHRTASSEVGPL